ncbi:unnamed protein product [Porites lobata]|uniref:THAP-type domain-containing protein n=1 Tax=Porites lobata TaxID=104759 RepID=A0ABN8NUS8_9CNID|nr:unnamed protein product [Porites lobata]
MNSPDSSSVRLKWKRFVSIHRKDFNTVGKFAVCSEHFTRDCYTLAFPMKGMKRNWKKGTFPTIWKKSSQTLSKRSRRSLLNEILAGQTANKDTEEEDNPEEEVISLKGSSAPEESADTMGAPNLNPEESLEVEGVLNTSQGSLLEVKKEDCIPETETGEISVDAEMASEVLGTPGDKTTLESQGFSGTDDVTETMQILEAQGIEKVQDMDKL